MHEFCALQTWWQFHAPILGGCPTLHGSFTFIIAGQVVDTHVEVSFRTNLTILTFTFVHNTELEVHAHNVMLYMNYA